MPTSRDHTLNAYAFDDLLVLQVGLARPVPAALALSINDIEVGHPRIEPIAASELLIIGVIAKHGGTGSFRIRLADRNGDPIAEHSTRSLPPLADRDLRTMPLATRLRIYDTLLNPTLNKTIGCRVSHRTIASSLALSDLFTAQTPDRRLYLRLPWPHTEASDTDSVRIDFDQPGGIRLTRMAHARLGDGWLHVFAQVPGNRIDDVILLIHIGASPPLPIRVRNTVRCADRESFMQVVCDRFSGKRAPLRQFIGRHLGAETTSSLPKGPRYAGGIDAVTLHPTSVHIAGWLCDRTQPNQTIDGRILLGERVIATPTANRFRQDLANRAIGNGHHGFETVVRTVLSSSEARQLRLAPRDSEPITRSSNTAVIRRTYPAGAIDRIDADTIIGWLHPSVLDGEPRMVEAYVGDRWLGSALSNRFRGDVIRHFRTDGFVGFAIPLSRQLHVNDLDRLRVVDAVSGEALSIPPAVTDNARHALENGLPECTPDYACAIDKVGEVVSGWAFDRNAPGARVTIDAYIDDVYIVSAVADGKRPDVGAETASDGFCGFAFSFPAGLALCGNVTLDLRYRTTGQSLETMPQPITLGIPGRTHPTVGGKETVTAPLAARPYQPPAEQPTATPDGDPSVAIIVLNRNGDAHLERMFRTFADTNSYRRFEFIVIDHGSTDRSRDIGFEWSKRLPVRWINRRRNHSYAESNNYAAGLTDAELLFLLNNDIAFTDDTLGRLARCFNDPEIAIVGMKLMSPHPPFKGRPSDAEALAAALLEPETASDPRTATAACLHWAYARALELWKSERAEQLGYTRLDPTDPASLRQPQHLGVKFETSHAHRAFLPYEVPLRPELKSIAASAWEVPAVTAGAMMIRRSDYLAVGGFHEEYFYGFEDVDFCLRARQTLNKKIVCVNSVGALHERSASRIRQTPYEKRIGERNKTTAERRLGPFLKRMMRETVLDESPFWRGHPFRVAFAVSDNSIDSEAGDYFTAMELGQALNERYGWEIHYLQPDEWYALEAFDVLIALVHGFDPREITSANPYLVTIAWIRNWFDGWLGQPWTELFDQLWVASQKAVERFSEQFRRPVVLMRIATNPQRFGAGRTSAEYASDYCFTGSFFKAPRQLISLLEPDALPYRFRLFGRNWEQIPWLERYCSGSLPYERMPSVYASTRIVLDDANHTVKEWGSVNSRVFDALAAGALVLTNGRTGAEELFGERCPVYDSRKTLDNLLRTYLEDEAARTALVETLRAEVLARHTYRHRAEEARLAIAQMLHRGRCRIVANNHRDQPNIKQLGALLYQALAAERFRPRFDGGGRLDHSLRPGDDLAIAIAGGTGSPPPLADCTDASVRVLIVLCRHDHLADDYLRAFDLLVTATATEAETVRDRSGRPTLALDEEALLDASDDALERTVAERLRTTLAERIVPALDQWCEQRLSALATIPPARVTPPPAAASTDADHHIAYVLWDFPALSQTFVLSELRWLTDHGYRVSVYYKTSPDRSAMLDFSIDAYPVTDPDDLADRLIARRHTMIHCHFAYPALTELAWPAAQRTQIPFTVMVHAVDIFHHANQNRNRLGEISNDPLCRKVFTLGDFHRNFLVSRGVPAGTIATIGQSAVLPAVEINRQDLTRRVYARKTVIGSLSRFTEKKGLSVLVDAAAALPDFEIRLYGYGPQEPALRRQIDALALDNVKIMGPIEGAKGLAAALGEIDLFVAPCVRTADGDMDGIPTVLLEAMACGVPVIATRVSGIPDLIRHAVNGFLANPGDSGDLARVVQGVAGMNPERLRRVVETAYNDVRSRFGVDLTMPTMLDMWNGETLDIVLVTFERDGYRTPAETKDIIQRLYKYTSTEFQLTIVDNDSDAGFVGELEALIADKPNARLIKLDDNVLCGPASNIGIANGRSRYIVYLCSKEGFVLKHGWERECIRYMNDNPDVGIAGNRIYSPQYYDAESYRRQEWFQHFRNPEFLDREPGRRFVHVQGGFFILRRAAYEQCGGFNEALPQGGMDIEYSYYLESCGWKLGSLPNVKIITTLTRPTLAASCDENTIVAHPLTVGQVQALDAVVGRRTKKCNVCGWTGNNFTGSEQCPACDSTPFARTLQRYLADSTLIHRGLRCLAIADGTGVRDTLGEMFELIASDPCLGADPEAVLARLEHAVDRENIDILILDHLRWSQSQVKRLSRLLSQLVGRGGHALVGENGTIAALARVGLPPERTAALAAVRLASLLPQIGTAVEIRYDSEVLRYDWQPIFEVAAKGAALPSAVNYRDRFLPPPGAISGDRADHG